MKRPLGTVVRIGALAAVTAAAHFAHACNSATGDFGAAGIGAGKKADDDKDEEDDEQGDIPAEVAGAFLTCGFMDDKSVVESKTKSDPNGNLEVACGIFKQHEDGKVKLLDAEDLSIFARIATPPDGVFDALSYKRNRFGAQMHFNAMVPIRYLAGAINVEIASKKAKARAAFIKSIPSIQTFGVRTLGFDIESDMTANGFALNSFGEIQILTPTEQQNPDSNWFATWIAPILVAAFGGDYGEPVSNDTGAEPYCGCGSGGYTSGSTSGDTFTTNSSSDYVPVRPEYRRPSWRPESDGSGSGSASGTNPSSTSQAQNTSGSQSTGTSGSQGSSTEQSTGTSGSQSTGTSQGTSEPQSTGTSASGPSGGDGATPPAGSGTEPPPATTP